MPTNKCDCEQEEKLPNRGTAGASVEWDYFEIKKHGRWFPRAIAVSLTEQYIAHWEQEGVTYRETTQEEYRNFYQKI